MEVEEMPPPPTGGGMAGGVDGGARTMKRFKHLKRSFVEVTVDSPNLENDTPARVEESNSFNEEITVDSDKEDDPSDGDCGRLWSESGGAGVVPHTPMQSAQSMHVLDEPPSMCNRTTSIPVANAFGFLKDLEDLTEAPVLLEKELRNKSVPNAKIQRSPVKAKNKPLRRWRRITIELVYSTRVALSIPRASPSSLVMFPVLLLVLMRSNGAFSSKSSSQVGINMSCCTRFVNNFNDCGLLDMGTMGVKYSWFRQEGGWTKLRRKLDRVFWNLDAQANFPEAKAAILPRTHSDHHPLKFIGVAGRPPRRDNRPFRF
nr:uncharacterized protein LOC109163410 [Ipomoea trifida]